MLQKYILQQLTSSLASGISLRPHRHFDLLPQTTVTRDIIGGAKDCIDLFDHAATYKVDAPTVTLRHLASIAPPNPG